MPKRDLIRAEIGILHDEGAKLAKNLQKNKETLIQYDYQLWYTKALRVVSSLAPDRLEKFKGYYEINPKRKFLGYGTYAIQDFFKGAAPAGYQYENWDSPRQVLTCFFNQLTILKAIYDSFDSILVNIEAELYAELQDNEVVVARQLIKVNLRAAGALVGVLIEGHLQKVAAAHSVKVIKKNPTIADLNDPLKSASVIDISTWRKISYLADLRNLCSHKKDPEPTKDQVRELIDGAEWLTKNVF